MYISYKTKNIKIGRITWQQNCFKVSIFSKFAHLCAHWKIFQLWEAVTPIIFAWFQKSFGFVISGDFSIDYIYYFWNRFHRKNDFCHAFRPPAPVCDSAFKKSKKYKIFDLKSRIKSQSIVTQFGFSNCHSLGDKRVLNGVQ